MTKSPNAYEKVVDRLLASKSYAERMTLHWMDVARYGDSSVHHADGPRTMWPWRDWVINAYHTNKSFKEFATEQIAGDLIPNATIDQKIATGFNRNHGTTDEGGLIVEEYRVEYVVDRVKTTAMSSLVSASNAPNATATSMIPYRTRNTTNFSRSSTTTPTAANKLAAATPRQWSMSSARKAKPSAKPPRPS